MKTEFKKILALCLCLIMICSISSITVAYASNSEADFCKIERTTATVTFNTFEKVKLYADYNICSDESYELVWTIARKSYFMNDFKDKTTGEEVELLFLDDTTVKLQVISANGNVLCEDEMFFKSYRNNNVSFWVNLEATFLMAIMIIVTILGGPIGTFNNFISRLSGK
jgi:hypothetical protein